MGPAACKHSNPNKAVWPCFFNHFCVILCICKFLEELLCWWIFWTWLRGDCRSQSLRQACLQLFWAPPFIDLRVLVYFLQPFHFIPFRFEYNWATYVEILYYRIWFSVARTLHEVIRGLTDDTHDSVHDQCYQVRNVELLGLKPGSTLMCLSSHMFNFED